MTTQDGTYQRLTVSEAAAELGVSRMTVRRMIARGQLEAERVLRPQGSAYLVVLPADGTGEGTPTAQVPRHRARPNGTAQVPRHRARPNGTAQGTPPGQATELGNPKLRPAGQLAAWSETFLVPLVAALERSQATVSSQAETIGRRAAELDAARARISTLEASGAPQAVETAVGAVLVPPAAWMGSRRNHGVCGDLRRGRAVGVATVIA